MAPKQRPAAAAIAAALLSGRPVKQVFDHAEGRWLPVEAQVVLGAVDAYDYVRHAHLAGPATAVFDYGEGDHLRFTAEDAGRVLGFDHASDTHFEVRLTGSVAALFDHASGAWEQFALA